MDCSLAQFKTSIQKQLKNLLAQRLFNSISLKRKKQFKKMESVQFSSGLCYNQFNPLYITQSFEACGITSQFNLHSTLNHILRSNTPINDFIDDLQEADEMACFDNDVDESSFASNDEQTVASAEPSVEQLIQEKSTLSISSSLQLTCIHTPSPLFIDKPQSSSQVNLAPISQTPNISQCVSSARMPLDIMMVRNDSPIYSQNNNIPIVVGT